MSVIDVGKGSDGIPEFVLNEFEYFPIFRVNYYYFFNIIFFKYIFPLKSGILNQQIDNYLLMDIIIIESR